MNFVIGQVISFGALIVAVVIAQFKDVKRILAGEIISNLSIALSYVFLGGISGAWICLAAAVQTVVIYLINRGSGEKSVPGMLLVLFAVVYIVGTVAVYRGWGDIVSCVCHAVSHGNCAEGCRQIQMVYGG